MDNITEESRVYPLKKIKEIRKKDEKKKRFLKLLLSILCCILAFSVGFVSGFYWADSDNSKGKSKAAVNSSAEITSDSDTGSDDFDSEIEILKEMEKTFVATMQQKHPEIEVSFAVKNLDSGIKNVHNNKKTEGAGVESLFIMESVLNEAANGAYELTEDRKTNLTMMIAQNNTEAANLFIDEFGGTDESAKIKPDNTIVKNIQSSDYASTEINGKLYSQAPADGSPVYPNYTCSKDVTSLMERIYNGSVSGNEYSILAMDILKQQAALGISQKIKQTYPDVTVAGKSGKSLNQENDVAFIMCDDFNLAFNIFVSGIPANADGTTNTEYHNAVCETISDTALELVKIYKENNF